MSEVITGPLWLHAYQKKQLDHFIQRGLPTRKEEHWKYTPITDRLAPYCQAQLLDANLHSHHDASHQIDEVTLKACKQYLAAKLNAENGLINKISLIFINGTFCKALSNIQELPNEVTLTSLSDATSSHEKSVKTYLGKEFDVQKFPFAVLASALYRDGMFLHIPKNVTLASPIHVIYFNTREQVHSRNLIISESGSQAHIIEEHISQTQCHFANIVTDIIANNNAMLSLYKIQDESIATTHTSNIFVHQCQDSRVNVFTLSKGALMARDDIYIMQAERGAECHLSGLYSLHHDEQHVDHHLQVDHAAEHGVSSMLYKGILDKKTRAVFNGKVHVYPDAQHINAYQANHNLLLSKEAEINTKPELEIYADNVKCAHGATVGQLDAESLFYFRSRGISKADALTLLLQAFADEVISKIQSDEIRHYMQTRVGSYVEL